MALVNLRADPAVQNRIDELADKCTEGTLSAVEQSEYETYMRAIDFIGVLQAQVRSLLQVVVTGDKHLLALKSYEHIRIVTPRIFLEVL